MSCWKWEGSWWFYENHHNLEQQKTDSFLKCELKDYKSFFIFLRRDWNLFLIFIWQINMQPKRFPFTANASRYFRDFLRLLLFRRTNSSSVSVEAGRNIPCFFNRIPLTHSSAQNKFPLRLYQSYIPHETWLRQSLKDSVEGLLNINKVRSGIRKIPSLNRSLFRDDAL